MSPMVGELHYRKVRAPQADGEVLIDPPASEFAHVLESNVARIQRYDVDIQGRRLSQLIREGRSQLVATALATTRQYRDVSMSAIQSAGAPILLAGHQPQLFHPGVWYKNFVLSGLAEANRAVAINLVIDSDVAKEPSIRVPSGTVDQPHLEAVAFDRPAPDVPYEERTILDRECWTSFGQRLSAHVRPLVSNPMVEQFWPLAIERSGATSRLGDCLSQARHQQEGSWGAQTLELPQSRVCQLDAFYWFAAHLLAHLPRLWDVYNSSVAEYRRVNHVRSSAHPVPDLGADDRWLEAPFWIWSSDAPRRKRLFVRQSGDELLLSNRAGIDVRLPVSAESDGEGAVYELSQLTRRGIKLRTRALITTMFARVVLGDLFIHGIGGAKYDQLTDAMIERFFGLQPPSYLTVTATVRLPLRLPQETGDDLHSLEARLRDLTYHPEVTLNGAALTPEASAAVQTKRHWISVLQTVANAKDRCRSIRAANDTLQPQVARMRSELLAQRQRVVDLLRRKNILASREFPFVVYPAEQLRALCTAPLPR